ncbi:Aldo/keto reductase [Fomitiporia mediterranea MF3/22]|uniref:Aldo/keto reductase n=1 Tax=Fomitiporia mediterranea (strain MF3/22) TaxID=694068 RepID=UPI0004407A2A|nr:Aldo/keto reductase [Fomitiporia mediterranea MF3/22]EJD08584.1 Aldo/keto reductase [Fomitiporia mediterranea MF3/22]
MSLNKIPTRQLGRDGPHVSSIGLGCMGIGAWYGNTDKDAAYKALTYAADRGMTFWDTADVYGDSEQVIGKWFKETGRRSDIFLATKFGAFDPETQGLQGRLNPISSPSYIKRALARSLARLGTSYIDLYYQHRVDPKVPIEIVLETLRPEVEKGAIRWVGLSECSAEVMRRARRVPGIGKRVVACQMEFSPFELVHEKDGFTKAAEEEGVAFVAYSPLARGLISGRYRSRADFDENDLRLLMPRFSEENFAKNLELVDKFKVVGEKYGATPSQIVLAWILAAYPNFIPIPGSRSADRVEENARAAELMSELKPEDISAIQALVEAADVHGERMPETYLKAHNDECIPLEEWKGEESKEWGVGKEDKC